MYGGTPSNISLSFLEEKRIEVITGVNLPMLLKLATYTEDMDLERLAIFITDYGQRNINLPARFSRKGWKRRKVKGTMKNAKCKVQSGKSKTRDRNWRIADCGVRRCRRFDLSGGFQFLALHFSFCILQWMF